jgi:hypothetical protein
MLLWALLNGISGNVINGFMWSISWRPFGNITYSQLTKVYGWLMLSSGYSNQIRWTQCDFCIGRTCEVLPAIYSRVRRPSRQSTWWARGPRPPRRWCSKPWPRRSYCSEHNRTKNDQNKKMLFCFLLCAHSVFVISEV